MAGPQEYFRRQQLEIELQTASADEPVSTATQRALGDELPASQRTQLVTRPHGGALLTGGLCAVCGGVALLGVSALLPTFSPWIFLAIWSGSGLISLGTLLCLTGAIVRAIFFLPGRTVIKGEIDSALIAEQAYRQ